MRSNVSFKKTGTHVKVIKSKLILEYFLVLVTLNMADWWKNCNTMKSLLLNSTIK
jgi:hypothetical protein